jgi:phage tail protein X
VPAEPRSAAEIMRRRALRRPRRRWSGWARVGVVAAALAVAAGVAALSAPGFTGQIAATGASLREAWNSLAERMTLARLRGASSSTPAVAPSGTVATVAGTPPAPALPAGRPGAGSETPASTIEPSLPPRGDATASRGDAGGRARPIVIPNGSTIAEIAFKSYGRYNLLAIDLIKEFNPHIADLNWIRAGEQLRLPSLDAETLIRRQPDGSYRVILGSFLSRRAAERIRDGVRRAGYDVDLLPRRLTDNLEVHRVEMTGLPTRDVAQQAWNTALAKCWLQLADTPCERTNHG